MEFIWIGSSIAAAFFQALRLAALKQLNQTLSIMVTSYVRVLFALPFLLLYLAGVLHWTNQPLPPVSPRFLFSSAAAAIMQFIGTALLVRLFQLGGFAVGTMLSKTDVLITAIIGTILFSEVISPSGWLAIVVTAAGVMLISAGRLATANTPGGAALLFSPSVRIGLLGGASFALSYLSVRDAILAVDPASGALVRSAYAAVAMTGCSFLLLGAWLLVKEREGLKRIRHAPGLCTFLGLSSALGTVFWFIASALVNAAYVASVAQVQVVFTLAISWFYFHERITKLELAGICTILGGLLLFRAV